MGQRIVLCSGAGNPQPYHPLVTRPLFFFRQFSNGSALTEQKLHLDARLTSTHLKLCAVAIKSVQNRSLHTVFSARSDETMFLGS